MCKDKIKFTYKEEHKLILILVFPVAIRQLEKFSDLSGLSSVPELPTKDSELLPANETLPAMETPLSKHREERRNGRFLVLVRTHKELRDYLVRILMPDYKVVSACDAEIAFTTTYEQHPNTALASSAFVEISGEELVVRIKSGDGVTHVLAILLVKLGEDSKETQRNADLYMTIPFVISFLKAEIENPITNQEAARKRYIRLTLGVDTPDNTEADVPLSDGDQELINLVRSLTEKRFTDSRFTIDELSDYVNMSRPNFYNRTKEITDHTPADYVRSMRFSKALTSLMSRKYTVAEAIDMTGFSDPKYLRIVFKRRFGDLPTKYMSNL